ncbi:MAG: mtDNA inheritance, partitioning of the mitochondrial organelle [Vezdaea acicularis]|nr:MAG: mtDNA inheritance, partitioning of the mitochondrial organelle [Vezdaea acicularis]
MHEIITVQLGQRSNYIATHFWNTQESYFTYPGEPESPVDHDVHFRPGIGADGSETFTPRTLIYDLKGGFGTLKQINALYDLQEGQAMPQGLWDGPTTIQSQPSIELNSYQRSLEDGLTPPALSPETVKYWSDFNRIYYHPRSIVQLNEYELNSSLMPFEKWDAGDELFASLDREHDLLDRDLRPFAEECDQMQGLQLITGADDAWGGFSARYMDRLRDEFGKTSIWVFGIEDGKQERREKQNVKALNAAKTTYEVSPLASMYIPMVAPPPRIPSHVSMIRESEWYTSALLAIALETATMPSRLRGLNGMRERLGGMEAIINTNGNQNIANLALSVTGSDSLDEEQPRNGSKVKDQRLPRRRSTNHNDLAGSLGVSSQTADDEIHFSPEQVVTRKQGLKAAHVFGATIMTRGGIDPSETEVRDGKEQKRNRAAGLPVIQRYCTTLRYPQLDSAPHLLSEAGGHPTSAAVRTLLSTTSSVAEHLRATSRLMQRLAPLDEREALINGLGEIREAYEEGWNSGSDSDDD